MDIVGSNMQSQDISRQLDTAFSVRALEEIIPAMTRDRVVLQLVASCEGPGAGPCAVYCEAGIVHHAFMFQHVSGQVGSTPKWFGTASIDVTNVKLYRRRRDENILF